MNLVVNDDTSCGVCAERRLKVDVGIQAVATVQDGGTDPPAEEASQLTQFKMSVHLEALLTEQNSLIKHYKELDIRHLSEIQLLQKRLDESAQSRRELEEKYEKLRDKLLSGLNPFTVRDCQQDPVLCVGGEFSEEVC